MPTGNEVNVTVTSGSSVNVTVPGASNSTPTVTNGGVVNVTVTSVGDRGPKGDAGSVNLSDATPQPTGTASAGTATAAARADHVHALSAHSHSAADITGLGTLATVSPTGTPSESTFLAGDNAWRTITSGTNYTAGSGITISGSTISAALTSVAGRTGAVTLAASDISGLGSLATVSPTGTASSTTFLAGDGAYRTPPGTTYTAGSGITISGSTIAAALTSVAGRTGAVTIAASDVSGLGTLATVSPTGTASSTTFLAGDGAYRTPATGIGANDAVDGGTYTGIEFSWISIQGQPADVTATVNSTVGGWNSIGAWSPLPRLYNAGDLFYPSVETIAAGAGRYMAIYTEENVFYNYSGSGSARIFSKRLYDSADGINWTAIGSRIDSPPWYPSVQPNPYSDANAAFLFYDGSRWIVAMSRLVSGNGAYLTSGMVLRTVSGSTVSEPIAVPSPYWRPLAFPSMVFFNGTYLYAGTNDSSFVFRSPDLTNWSSENAATLPSYNNAYPIKGALAATQNCVVFVVQTNNQGQNRIAYASTDGETWQSPVVASSYSEQLSLAASSSQFVLASGGTGLKISSNGTAWTSVTAPRPVSRVFWANDRFIGLDSASTYEYVYSFNGTNWYVGSLGTSAARRFAAGNGSTTIVGGDSGGIVSSFTASSASATYTVSATPVNAGAISYQWQASSDGGSTYASINGATSATLSLSGLTTADTGKRYRCMMTASGAATTYSRAATLTVN